MRTPSTRERNLRNRRDLWKLMVFAAFSAAVLSLGPAQAATPALDSPAGRIALTGCTDTGCNIYTVNPDGSALQQVTHDDSSVESDWSPDGTLIAYVSDVSGFTSIWIADAQGGNARQLTPDDSRSANIWPRFMPDGRTILYTNCLGRDCDGGISAIDVDGSNQRAITPNSGSSYNFATASPDGRRLAFQRWHVEGRMMGIYLLRLGADPERRVSPRELEGWAPEWTPDGERIIFSSNIFRNRPNGAIYSIRPDGNGLQQLTHPKFPLEDWSAAVSPNGDRIVFASDRRYPDRCCSDLFTLRIDESDRQDAREEGERRQVRRIPIALRFVDDPRWGTAPLLPETSTSASLAIEPAANSLSNSSVIGGTVPARPAAAFRQVCRVDPLLKRTAMCRGQ